MRALVLVLAAAACGSPSSGSGSDGGGGDDDGGGGGSVADVPCDCLEAPATVDGPAADSPTADTPVNTACPTYCVENVAGVTGILYGVVAVSSSEAFAVGDGGVILHRTGGAWTQMTSGTTEDLRGVWAASPTDVWAVGHGGTILRYNGSMWTAVTGVTTSDCVAVWGSGAADVWVVATGRLHHYTGGSTWTMTSVAGTLLGISGTGANDIWLATENAYLKHYTGTTWGTVMPTGGGADAFAVLAMPAAVWTSNVTPGKETLRLVGSTWSAHATSSTIFQGYYGAEANDVWAVGGAKVGRWNGTSWTVTVPTGNTNNLCGVSGSGADVYIVGSGGTILHHN
jgi:hypothetical protein